ncbi:9677_t:CDS:1, partial [Scutellospora calospora]
MQSSSLKKNLKKTAACTNCQVKKIRCNYKDKGPCEECIKNKCDCKFGQQQKRGPKKENTPSKLDFQNWGEVVWQSLGKNKEAVLQFIQSMININANLVLDDPLAINNEPTVEQTVPYFDQNIQSTRNLDRNSLNNEQALYNSSQETLPSGRLVDKSLEIYHKQMSELVQADILKGNYSLATNEEHLSYLFKNVTGNSLTYNEQTFTENRSSRNISRQQQQQHRSSSREKRQRRKEARNNDLYKNVSYSNDSHSRSPNNMNLTYSNRKQQNLIPLQLPGDSRSISPINTPAITISPYESYFSENNAFPVSLATSPNGLSSQSSPLIPFEWEDVNQLLYPTTNFQTSFSFEEANQLSHPIDPTINTQTPS